jgi:aminoglycoside 3-N-acetyltransferase
VRQLETDLKLGLRTVLRLLPEGATARLSKMRRAQLARRRAKAPPVTLSELSDALARVGLAPGHHVYVHSSLIDMPGLKGNPAQIVQLLLDMVGPTGTILMQARGWSGRSIDHARRNVPFDPLRTPSADGIITEVFRRWPGTIRSRHPIFSSAANGALARQMLEGHEFADPPFGAESPWGRLCEAGGYVLMLGVGLRALTLVHAALDLYDGPEPFPVYAEGRFPQTIIEADGTRTTISSRAHAGKLDGVSIINSLVPHLDRARLIRRELVGGIALHYFPARESVACMIEAAKKGKIRKRYV